MDLEKQMFIRLFVGLFFCENIIAKFFLAQIWCHVHEFEGLFYDREVVSNEKFRIYMTFCKVFCDCKEIIKMLWKIFKTNNAGSVQSFSSSIFWVSSSTF